MTTPCNGSNPYAAPGAVVSQVVEPVGFPRRRFWLSCLGWATLVPFLIAMLFLSVSGIGFPIFVGVATGGLLVLWIATVIWVLKAHRETGFAYRATVALGLTLALIVCFVCGMLVFTKLLVMHPVTVTLPGSAG